MANNIIIIGAGLSGLYLAWQLEQALPADTRLIILEARERTGGRILSPQWGESAQGRVDLGPAWIWPQFQPRLARLMDELHCRSFRQFTRGNMLYENAERKLQQFGGPSSHDQSYRVVAGTAELINALQRQLQRSEIHLHTEVNSIDLRSGKITATCAADNAEKPVSYDADKIILALPLRLLAQNIQLTPPVDAALLQQWNNTATWMASHCKIIFIYAQAFWREQQCSGEVFSHYGPMSEIYDASPDDESVYALSAFIGLNAQQRKQIGKDALISACRAQLQRLFGDAAAQPQKIFIEDWSENPYTASELDLNTPAQHPHYHEDAPRVLGDNRVYLAGTETALEHGGYLEGALESADCIVNLLNQHNAG
ncbi:MAG TPA: FAD-dependent oxidoreductase [Gammaproteobacteria bacterium]